MNKAMLVAATVAALAAVSVLALTIRSDRAAQIEVLERRINELEHRVAGLVTTPVDTELTDRLATLAAGVVETEIGNETDPSDPETIEPKVMARLQHVEHTVAETDRTLSKKIDERVAEVVDEEISKLEKKQNKKPSISDFADVLELDYDQRSVVEDVIWLGQDSVRTLLEIPTADGSLPLDGLVDALAYAEAGRPEAGQVFMEWVGQLMSTKIPESDVTYAGAIEAAKNDVRAELRQELTEKQYAEFERWKVDPTEIQEIEESPWTDLGDRIAQRMEELTE